MASKQRKLDIACVSVSETGHVRKDNQDSFFVDAEKTVFCVADGMGGGAEGATASRFVCEAISKVARTDGLKSRKQVVNAAIAIANQRIYTYSQSKHYDQMGSTLVVLLLEPSEPKKAMICHIGDSRIYRIRRGSAELLTKDHTIGGLLGDLMTGTRAIGFKSRANPLAHVLTRAIGVEDTVAGEWRTVDVEAGDRFLLCSDGVHDVIPDSLIGEIFTMSDNLNAASKRLSETVVLRGSPDNYTYLMVEVGAAMRAKKVDSGR